MRISYPSEQSKISWSRWLGVLCIALVLLTGFVQVMHTHTDGRVDHEGCSLCITVHHVAQSAALITLAVSVQPIVQLTPDFRDELLPRQRFLLKLANRPPPVSPAFA
jgi:hypothetical protein